MCIREFIFGRRDVLLVQLKRKSGFVGTSGSLRCRLRLIPRQPAINDWRCRLVDDAWLQHATIVWLEETGLRVEVNHRSRNRCHGHELALFGASDSYDP